MPTGVVSWSRPAGVTTPFRPSTVPLVTSHDSSNARRVARQRAGVLRAVARRLELDAEQVARCRPR